MAYQTFPWQRGSSRSFEKLLSLYLPVLNRRTLLDVGCNTGFFCGWAAFQGAVKARGIDINSAFVKQAKEWFPECSFACQSWEKLGPEAYDVLLCLSAIHYAKDQRALIDFLMQRVKPDGLLVLELGIAPGEEERFVPVTRKLTAERTDTRLFPTRPMVRRMLENYVFKRIGQSVMQAGDPLPREVWHIYHKRPLAVLFLDDHYSGKSSVCEALLRPGIARVAGDHVYHAVARGEIAASEEFKNSLFFMEGTTHLKSMESITAICTKGLLPELLAICAAQAGRGDFALDSYLPYAYREKASAILHDMGYYVVDVALYAAHRKPWTNVRPPYARYKAYLAALEKRMEIDEEAYLAANPDVALAVAEGRVASAREHYWSHGRREKRRLKPE